MNLQIRVRYLKLLREGGGSDMGEDIRWHNDEKFITLDTNRFTDADLTKLRTIAQEAKDEQGKQEAGALALVRRINTFFKLKANPSGTPVKLISALVEAIRVYLKDAPHHWVFKQEADGEMVPYYVERAVYYEPNERNEVPAHVILSLVANVRRERDSTNFRFETDSLCGNVVDILQSKGLFRETPEMVADYEAACARYEQISGQTGAQFMASDTAFFSAGRYYGGNLIEMTVDGVPSRVVMDDLEGDERESTRSSDKESRTVSSQFWSDKQRKGQYEQEDAGDEKHDYVVPPLHPYVLVFDLLKHRHVIIHATYLAEYQYDETMIEKLVLPKQDKDLIHMLVRGADEQMEDIVKGKTGGIIVIATGPPGTGKTLTAEVFSELVHRPLYCVQCSQLGTDEEDLEKKLEVVLRRATRWQAILLIDEADVYVHERGSDIAQNAIVGVWLRILEHYRGILFLTSNRSTIIDDAIMSRATAWIRYDRPSPELLRHIWSVLSTQYQVKLTAEMIEQLVATPRLQHISGRAVKNLLKLARLQGRQSNEPVSVKVIDYVSHYLDIEDKTEAAPDGLLDGLMPYPMPMLPSAYAKVMGFLKK